MPVKNLSNPQAQQRIEKLSKQINELRYRYHVLDDPSITDEIYDSLTQELLALENHYPQFKLKNSPTDRVVGGALDNFEKITHPKRMLSLTHPFNYHNLTDTKPPLKKI